MSKQEAQAKRAGGARKGIALRLIKTLFSFYPVLLPAVVAGIVLCAIINSIGAVFLQGALEVISTSWQTGDWEAARPQILQLAVTLGVIDAVGVASSLFWNRNMATITQGSLETLREKMFNRMQDLPIRYFDTHQHGDIMSHYTNDIDTLRQMISQSLPNLLMTVIVIISVFCIMLYYSVWMCLVIIAGVACMMLMTKLLGGRSARNFIAQQKELGAVEGHIEEVMGGQKVAFVGATGAGKTTITNLINRFYDIADGKIRYDGINVNKIRKSDLRRSLGVVLQDVNLFTGTVMDNIRYGNLDATDEECIAAAKLAGADDFITRLPDGYDTMLTGNGAQLSQGQRQLISIARAAVADPPAMILDEATSSIDTRTEAIVQEGMDKLMEGRTTFVIAHRLSTVRNSDAIICLDHGRIIERGNHDELIAKRGYYYQLYTGAFELE